MTTPPPDRQGQQLLVQLGVSALVGVIALVVLLQADSKRGVLFWVLLAVVVSSAGEAAWFLSKYLRLARDRERIN